MRRTSYAVWWTEGDGPRHAGKIELGPLHALLSGNGGGRVAVAFDEIAAVACRRGKLELTRRYGTSLCIGSLDAPGALLELAGRLVS
jgi:hypothetical protein